MKALFTSNSNKRFLLKVFAFILVICLIAQVYIWLSPLILVKSFGPTTEQIVAKSFQNAMNTDYDCLVVGSSKLFRGLNPDKISCVKTYNFSHDNDTYNQFFYKLQYMKDHEKMNFDYIIVGVSYFSFCFVSDTRNYLYFKYFKEEYKSDYENLEKEKSPFFYFKVLDKKISQLFTLKISNTFRPTLFALTQTLLRKKNTCSYVKENGQYILLPITKASKNDKAAMGSTITSTEVLPIQKKYFLQILDFAKANNKKVILLFAPARSEEIEMTKASVKSEIDNLISEKVNNKSVFFLDFSRDKNFKLTDFTDITHLNPNAADKFSVMLNDSVKTVLKR
jgi:hypothetical protein